MIFTNITNKKGRLFVSIEFTLLYSSQYGKSNQKIPVKLLNENKSVFIDRDALHNTDLEVPK